MSDLIHDINVKYINSTGQNNFMVVVFTKNENVNAINTPFVAWHTLKAQSSSSFVYPVQAAVAAYWEYPSGVKNTAGPFDSDLGSTWTMSTLTMESSPNLKQGIPYKVLILGMNQGDLFLHFFQIWLHKQIPITPLW